MGIVLFGPAIALEAGMDVSLFSFEIISCSKGLCFYAPPNASIVNSLLVNIHTRTQPHMRAFNLTLFRLYKYESKNNDSIYKLHVI